MRVDQARQQRRVLTVNEDVAGTPDSGVTNSGDAAVLHPDVGGRQNPAAAGEHADVADREGLVGAHTDNVRS